jgi:hypothetical protein
MVEREAPMVAWEGSGCNRKGGSKAKVQSEATNAVEGEDSEDKQGGDGDG